MGLHPSFYRSVNTLGFPEGGKLEYYLLGPSAVSANWDFCTYQPLRASGSALATVFVI